MPYTKPSEAPDWVRKKGDSASRMWIEVFNSAFKQYEGDEGKAIATANAAVKKKYASDAARAFVESFPETFEGTKVRVQLFPIGRWDGHPDGPFEITPELLSKAKENFESTGRALPVDFDHGLDFGETPEERRAAGWIKELEITDDGLFATFDATDEAANWIRGGQYRFISPTFTWDFTNKESGEGQGFTLLRAGLTNTPFFDGMFPCVAANERTRKAIAVEVASEYGRTGTFTVKCKSSMTLADAVAKQSEAGFEVIGFYQDVLMTEPKKAVVCGGCGADLADYPAAAAAHQCAPHVSVGSKNEKTLSDRTEAEIARLVRVNS